MLNLIAINETEGQYYAIHDAKIMGWSSHYGEEGGGFGYLRFSVKRSTEYDWQDIQYGFRVKLYKYLGKLLFDGQIRQIEGRTNPDGDEIVVTALGWVIVADDDELFTHFCDARLAKWRPAFGEIPRATYQPGQYTLSTNDLALYIHCNNDQEYESGEYIAVRYQFNDFTGTDPFDEIAERIKCTLSIVLGNGIVFDAEVAQALFSAKINTVDDGTDTVVYKDDSNEDTVINGDTLVNVTRSETATISTITQATNTIVLSGSPDLSTWAADDSLEIEEGRIKYQLSSNEGGLAAGMVVSNITQDKQAVVESVDTGNDTITFVSRGDVSGWVVGDDMVTPGPLFWANISSISDDDLVYTNDVGEGNVQTGWQLVNVTKKAVATVSGINTTTNTITVTDADDISLWDDEDYIIQPTSLFYAVISSVASATITYGSDTGERFVSLDTGWVLYNATRDEYAEVDSWNTASSQLDVTDSGDISSWVNGNVIQIFTPFKFSISNTDGILWPAGGEWRQGAVIQTDISIDVSTVGSPTYFDIVLANYIDGEAGESTFVQLEDLQVYNTTDTVTPIMLAEYIVGLLSDSGHGLSGDTWDIDPTLTNVLEPMVFEFQSPKEAMQWVCGFGDGGSPPALTAWGVRLDDSRRFYLELQDLEEVSYYIVRNPPAEVQMGGDINPSVQRLQAVYTDRKGEDQFTTWSSDTDAYFSGKWRRKRLRLDNVNNATDAAVAMELYLNENKGETRRASYRVVDGTVFSPGWLPIPFDEIVATGKLVKIGGARLGSDISSSDRRDAWTTERIVAVEIDYQNGSANIIPAGAKGSFERYMAELARLAER